MCKIIATVKNSLAYDLMRILICFYLMNQSSFNVYEQQLIIEEFNNIYNYMNLSLVLHRKQWELSEFSVTKEELDLAEKHPQ